MNVGTQSVVITGIICVLWWMVAYAAIIYRGFRDRSYGMPVAALGANLSWAFICSFPLDPFTGQIHILSIPCFAIGLVIATSASGTVRAAPASRWCGAISRGWWRPR